MGGVRHVWVKLPFQPVLLAGLLIGWRRAPNGWEGLVSYVDPQGRIITDWLPADHLQPVGARPGIGSSYG